MSTWHSIPGFPLHMANEMGEVKSMRFKNHRILKPTKSASGYLTYSVNGKNELAHRLIALAFCDGYKKEFDVNHKNGIRADNRSENLEWVSRSENINHSYSVLNRPSPPGPRPKTIIVGVHLESGKIERWVRVSDAAKSIGAYSTSISKAIHKRYPSICGWVLHREKINGK